MKSRTDDDLMRTAYHEAGHVVVGTALKMKVMGANIKRRETKDYIITGSTFLKHKYVTRLNDRVCFNMAGDETIAVLLGMKYKPSSGDVDSSVCCFNLMGIEAKDYKEAIPPFIKKTHQLIKRNKHKIDRVAYALLDSKQLNAKQIRELVDD